MTQVLEQIIVAGFREFDSPTKEIITEAAAALFRRAGEVRVVRTCEKKKRVFY